MSTECNNCVALKERIRQLEEKLEQLQEKDRSKFFCKMCKTSTSYSTKQKVKWHVLTRHADHFGLEKLNKVQINCMRIKQLPDDYQVALGKGSEINFAKYFSGKIKISPLSVISKISI